MTFDEMALLGLGYACFVVAWLLYIVHLVRRSDYLGRLATYTQTGGALLWAAGYIWRMAGRGDWPVFHVRHVCLLLALMCVIVSLSWERLYHTRASSPFVLLVALALGGYALFAPSNAAGFPQIAEPAFRNLWFLLYFVLAAVGYAMFLVNGALSVLDLIRPLLMRWDLDHGLPSDEAVGTMSRQTIGWALVALTVALAAGAWWSWLATGLYWHWRAGEVWMLTLWAAYTALLHLGHFRWWSVVSAAGMGLVCLAIGSLGM